ncbi:DUF5808 domain-containing protein [Pseudoalteromonas sp. BDTF-M6]|uniref:DUF5808 domain-containing protein n=1 Tax=Pseudoalteromonas sp. BDTF-M6 TaxID=2796132 RepID=UPI001BB08DA6|nr:DUF5808 domain-containing protein [Pseudoalteromonas sp. BDTF-M6]MBS3797095.1 hypothetical protein [Pseudoalteromonas sp. BDTF-M6]
MTQDEINQAEWSNDDNWTRLKWMGLYFSKKDSRAWVPKPYPILGWTVNLANPGGVLSLSSIIAMLMLISGLVGYNLAL